MRRLLLSFILCQFLCSLAEAQDRAEVLLETTEGNIRIALYNETPLHRDNFLQLVDQHVYDSLLFHRVIRNFMIQAGDPKSRHAEPGVELGEGDLGYTIDLTDEAKQFVAEKGYDVQFGARPLKRAIQTYIEDGISELIVNGDLSEGSVIHINKAEDKDELTFTT